jgi:hypothetical protein
MTIAALVVRRFGVEVNGVASIAQVAKQVELPALPGHGTLLDFADHTGAAPISMISMHAVGAHPPALAPPRVELRCKTEPADRLQPALEAGWVALPMESA